MNDLSQNWEKIPLWDNSGRCFEITVDPFSGRIPVTRLEHWRDFPNLIEGSFFNQPYVQWIYRGQRRFDWKLTPSLGRMPGENGIVKEDLAKRILSLFRKAIRGRIGDHSLFEDGKEDDELWAIGQHHGLMTPLLDWTYSPYVALFFAFVDDDQPEESDNPYRVVYIVNKSFIADDKKCPDIRVFEPKKDDHGRLVSQAGLFTFSPYDSTIENKLYDILSDKNFAEELKGVSEKDKAVILARYICKVYVRNEKQKECLKFLRRMNVHHGSLFPDLIGAARYCNICFEELEQERQLAKYLKKSEKQFLKKEYKTKEKTFLKIADQEFTSISDLLRKPLKNNEMEPGVIELLANELAKVLKKGKLIDWQERESLQAAMRNSTRALLRRYSYPPEKRIIIVDNILKVKTEDEEGEDTE